VNTDLKVADSSFLCVVSLFPLMTVLGMITVFQTWGQV